MRFRITITNLLITLIAAAGSINVVLADTKNLFLPTPPMGFNNWARFECNLNQTLFTTTAEAMIKTNLLNVGYNRINIDDCWMTNERSSENNSLQWNTTIFPDGLIWLGDYLHQRGFHFGIYEDAGTETCSGLPGSLGFEEIDAYTFQNWGIDYLKLDGCNLPDFDGLNDEATYQSVYGKWHEVLSNMSNPLIFSESAPAYFSDMSNLTDWYTVMGWCPVYGQLARHSADIATYGSGDYWESILFNYGQEVLVARYQKPGYFNDPDFLIPDYPDLTIHEKKSQFALWASFSAPLIISAYIPNLTSEELDYLTNTDLIAVDQDPLGLQATLVSQDGTWDVLTKNLENGDRLLTVLNRGNSSANYSVSLSRLGFSSPCTVQVKDLWSGEMTTTTLSVDMSIPPHGTAAFRISSKSQTCGDIIPTGMIFNTKSLNCLKGTTNSSVSTEPCDATDKQVWQVKPDGSIRNLANPSHCLKEGAKGRVSLTSCGTVSPSQKWKYYQSGNVVNVLSGNCLTEKNTSVPLTATSCLYEANSQVFGMPSGVEVL